MITTLVHPNFTSWCFDAFERAKVLSHHESMERASNTFVRCSGSSDLFKTRMVLFFAAARQENLCWGALSHWARAWLSEGLTLPTRLLAGEWILWAVGVLLWACGATHTSPVLKRSEDPERLFVWALPSSAMGQRRFIGRDITRCREQEVNFGNVPAVNFGTSKTCRASRKKFSRLFENFWI